MLIGLIRSNSPDRVFESSVQYNSNDYDYDYDYDYDKKRTLENPLKETVSLL